MNKDMASLRKKIDDIDDQILVLLGERTDLSVQVGTLRGNASQDIIREDSVISRLLRSNKVATLDNQTIINIWRSVFKHSRQAQAHSIDTMKPGI